MQANIHFREDCLVNTFTISRENANRVMSLLRNCQKALLAEDYYGHPSHLVADTLEKVSPLINGYGREGFLFEGSSDAGLQYVNMGDPYHTTIVWSDEISSFSLGGWGNFLEDYESQNPREEEEGDCFDSRRFQDHDDR